MHLLGQRGVTSCSSPVADSYDNALAETVNGCCKAEPIRGPARTSPWKSVEDVELATLGWAGWHNTTRLHGYLNDVPPAEYEAAFYAATGTDHTEVDFPTLEPLREPGRLTSPPPQRASSP